MPDCRQNSVLIVDDMSSNIQVLFEILRHSGFQVSVAKTARSGIRQAHRRQPDLILLDLILPDLHGFEACRRLKSDPATQDIPIIFLSALDEVIDKVKAFGVGGIDYITKPFEAQEVLARVKTHIALQATKAEVCRLNTELEERVRQRTFQLEAINEELQGEIWERQQIEEALLDSEERFRLAFELAPIGMTIADLQGAFLQVNQSLCHVLGYRHEELCGQSWDDLLVPEDIRSFQRSQQQIQQGEIEDFRMEYRFLTNQGHVVHGLLQVALLRDQIGGPLHLLSQFVDISDRKRAEEQLRHTSLHDTLTSLPNRALLTERIEAILLQYKRNSLKQFAVLFIDVDRFKVLNDSLGHQAGDQLLVAIANRLLTVTRNHDTIARLGGDEFVVLLTELTGLRDAIFIAERIAEILATPLQIEGREVRPTASIGIVLGREEYTCASELLRDADIAMYRAKNNGKAQYAVFDQQMHTAALAQLQIEHDLQMALEREELELHYQPIVTCPGGKLLGFEALLRWQHPERGWISPADFIPVAEETGLILPIGTWLLHRACHQIRWWQKIYHSMRHCKISVNLSVRQLICPHFLRDLDHALEDSTLNPASLHLEITESMLMENIRELQPVVQQLKSRGIQLGIDDFGTGYSSLSYLHQFPIDALKIDRSFVSRLELGSKDYKITQTIITLAHQLGIRAIAEGVEEYHQLETLAKLGCDEAQGYLFAKPLDVEGVEAMAESQTEDLDEGLKWMSDRKIELLPPPSSQGRRSA